MQTTIDEKEVEKFAKIADEWWDKNGKFKPLHQLNPIRISYIQEKIGNLQDVSILDIGCGGGLLAEPLAMLGAKVTAIDASEKNIAIAKAHQQKSGAGVEYLHSTVEEMSGYSRKFDLVLNMEVVEHVNDPALFMQLSANLVGEKGKMIVATINRTMKSYLFAIIGAEYVLKLLPKNTHNWNKFLQPAEIDAMIDNLLLKEIKGVAYNPFTEKFAVTDDLSVNYMIMFENN